MKAPKPTVYRRTEPPKPAEKKPSKRKKKSADE